MGDGKPQSGGGMMKTDYRRILALSKEQGLYKNRADAEVNRGLHRTYSDTSANIEKHRDNFGIKYYLSL